jgi:hypothetical protein
MNPAPLVKQGSYGRNSRSAGGAEKCSSPPPAIGPDLGGERGELMGLPHHSPSFAGDRRLTGVSCSQTSMS